MVSRGQSAPTRQVVAFLTFPRFDAFRSIFPAGTVSGAPKIKAVELVYDLEQERRGVYAGAAGRFDFADDAMDTCIAIRITVFKDGVAYLQAGGGIVHDSVEEDEYNESMNKLKGNANALEDAEGKCSWSALTFTECPQSGYWYRLQQAAKPSG